MGEVGVIAAELLGEQHAFVNDRFVRQARDVEKLTASNLAGVPDRVFGPFADNVEFAFECLIVSELPVATDKQLPHPGFCGAGSRTKGGIVGGNSAPPEDSLTFFGYDL